MASTFRPSILNGSINPDTSGNVWWEPASVAETNGFFPAGLWRFKNSGSAKIKIRGSWNVPKNYNASGTTTVVVAWSTTATSNSVVWGFEYRSIGGDDTTSIDQSSAVETLSVTDAAPTAAWRRLVTTMTVTASNLAADDTLLFNFYRDKSSGSDTLAADAYLIGLYLQYTD